MKNPNKKKSFTAPLLGAALVTATTCSLAAAMFTLPGHAFADQWESYSSQIDAIDAGDTAKTLVAGEDVSGENQNDAGSSGVDDIVWGESQGIPDWAESIDFGGPEYDDGEYEITDDPFGVDELGDDDFGGNDLGGDEFGDDNDAEIAEDQDAEDQENQNDAGNSGSSDDELGGDDLGDDELDDDVEIADDSTVDEEESADINTAEPGQQEQDQKADEEVKADEEQQEQEQGQKGHDTADAEDQKHDAEEAVQEQESKTEEKRVAENSEDAADESGSNSSDQSATVTNESNTTYNYEYTYENTTETNYEYLYNNIEYGVVEVFHDGGICDRVHQCNGYILPESSSRIYSRLELECLSNWELYLARNEMYARHGRGFVNSDLQNYFNSCSWYTRQYDPAYFDANFSLSDIEMANAEIMKDIEYSRNSPYVS